MCVTTQGHTERQQGEAERLDHRDDFVDGCCSRGIELGVDTDRCAREQP